MNTLRYVYRAWIGIDAENHFFLGYDAVLYGETDELYEFLFTKTHEMTPGFEAEDVL